MLVSDYTEDMTSIVGAVVALLMLCVSHILLSALKQGAVSLEARTREPETGHPAECSSHARLQPKQASIAGNR